MNRENMAVRQSAAPPVFREQYRENVREMDRVFSVEENFDLLKKPGREAALYKCKHAYLLIPLSSGIFRLFCSPACGSRL